VPIQRLLVYVLVLVAGYLAYLVLKPFLVPLAWAAVFAIMFHRVQVDLLPKLGANRAALVTTLMAALLIVAPAVMLVSALVNELPQVIEYVQQASVSAPRQIERIWSFVRVRSPMELPEDPTMILRDAIERALTFVAPRAGAVAADVVATLGSLAVMLFALFFLLRDGDVLCRQLRDALPFPHAASDRLLHDTQDMVIASVGAGLLVAVAQGAIGGVTFWLLGMNAPVVWGLAIAFCSLIPVVGAALVWVPAALWLAFSGAIWSAVILAAVGVVGIGMVDNILRPLMLSGRTSASGLVIFLGLLGGASAFGFIGLVVGPIILVTAASLFRMFSQTDFAERPPHGSEGSTAVV
jgi:predicted PurR-regulated permease PerM